MSSEETSVVDNSPDSTGSKDNALLEPKPKPKVIRVLTVLAYVLSVSMAAILLSIYYIFMWEGHPHVGARKSYENFNRSIALKSVEYRSFGNAIKQPLISDGNFSKMEMQQQIPSTDDVDLSIPVSTSTEENTTWPDYDFNSDFQDFKKRSTFIKKLMHNNYPYAEND